MGTGYTRRGLRGTPVAGTVPDFPRNGREGGRIAVRRERGPLVTGAKLAEPRRSGPVRTCDKSLKDNGESGSASLVAPASKPRLWSRSSDIRKFRGKRCKRQSSSPTKPPPFRGKVDRSDCPATHLGGLSCRAFHSLISPIRTQPRRTLIQRQATRLCRPRRRGRSRSVCPHPPQAIFRRRVSLLAFRPPCRRRYRQTRRCHSRKRDRWLHLKFPPGTPRGHPRTGCGEGRVAGLCSSHPLCRPLTRRG
jgi:hypothetical protein